MLYAIAETTIPNPISLITIYHYSEGLNREEFGLKWLLGLPSYFEGPAELKKR